MNNCKYFFETANCAAGWPCDLGAYEENNSKAIQCGVMGIFKCYILTSLTTVNISNYMRKFIAETPAHEQPLDNIFLTNLKSANLIKETQEKTDTNSITINGDFIKSK